ncbi:hypothetical protein MtrunA17_Chr1g0196431 [Medicago truncatula]|uniref:Uncharacterized protein n=1 Tax=Medicago truncatula TaxID=3880 RepID=A0A396JSA6_MEDTR|nr:hypothetical protein MtrunA17_Chr1g0196431 [Medicago truncatula]
MLFGGLSFVDFDREFMSNVLVFPTTLFSSSNVVVVGSAGAIEKSAALKVATRICF